MQKSSAFDVPANATTDWVRGRSLTHFFINPLDVVMETGTRAVPLEPVPALVLDKFWMDFLDLSKDQAIVHTTLRRIR
jgi:hypothetical protein